jgi:hypothetical protein
MAAKSLPQQVSALIAAGVSAQISVRGSGKDLRDVLDRMADRIDDVSAMISVRGAPRK